MNQVFSFNRFKLLVLMHWAHNKKRYGLSVLAFMGLLIVFFLFSILTADDGGRSEDVQKIRYFLPLYVVGTFYASQYFQDLGSRTKASNFLNWLLLMISNPFVGSSISKTLALVAIAKEMRTFFFWP